MKLNYLKTLVSGKAKTTISECDYCGAMYKDALKTLERTFGQPQTVVSAYVDKLANYPQSKCIIVTAISAFLPLFPPGLVFSDLWTMYKICQVLPCWAKPYRNIRQNLKEAWSMNTVKRNLDRPTLIQFNNWLKEKAEAHERMKVTSSKPTTDDVLTSTVTKSKTGTKDFAATSSNQDTTGTKPTSGKRCVACKESHPL